MTLDIPLAALEAVKLITTKRTSQSLRPTNSGRRLQGAYREQLTQLRFETVKNLLEVLEVILFLGNQLEILLLTGFNTQLQVFQPVLHAGQGCIHTISVTELHDGVHTL